MKKHISYPKIQQFRNTISDINRKVSFIGFDKDGEAIYDPSIKKPTLTFTGTVKLHGTNSSICFNSKDGFWIQSRKNIITVEKDNAGFAFFVEKNKIKLCSLLNDIIDKYQIDTNEFTVSLYGEWAGKGIQKGVGISELEKAFYIFGVKISKPQDELFNAYWLSSEGLRSPENRIFNVEDFQKFSIDIDFNMPQLAQNKLIDITSQVEKECPISKVFGISGIGEGVVWKTEYKGNIYRFKVKGDKHSSTKVKKLANVDIEKLKNIQEFVDYAVTRNRFEQSLENIFDKNDIDVKKLGEVIRWIVKDITSEEIDTMIKNNLEPKDVNRYISSKVRDMFFEL